VDGFRSAPVLPYCHDVLQRVRAPMPELYF
jgi:hypothetical protein